MKCSGAMDGERRIAAIRSRLQDALQPDDLMVEDEGYLHVGHEGAKDGRGHFRVLVVARRFCGVPMLERHRLIYEALGGLMSTDIHALAIDAYAPEEL